MWNAIKAAASAGITAISKVPVSGLIKAGIFIGVAGFTFWVMVRRTKKMRKEMHNNEEVFRSPVDEILGKNYAGNVDDFDDLDPAAKEICKTLNKSYRKKHKKAKRKAKSRSNKDVRVVSLFDDPTDIDAMAKEIEETGEVPHFYKDAVDMMVNGSKRKTSKRKAANAKRRARKRFSDRMRDTAEEWKESGCASVETIKDRITQVGKDLGLVDSDDEETGDADISPEFKAANPTLF